MKLRHQRFLEGRWAHLESLVVPSSSKERPDYFAALGPPSKNDPPERHALWARLGNAGRADTDEALFGQAEDAWIERDFRLCRDTLKALGF